MINFFKKKETKKKGVGGNVIHVVIKKKLGEGLISTIAEFDVTQIQDENYNSKLVNTDLNFKEDYSFEKITAISILESKLGGLSQDEQIKEIEKKIKKQTERLKLIKDGRLFSSENISKYDAASTQEAKDLIPCETINIIDENNELKSLKGALFYFQHKGNTSYEELDINGKRQITFLARDGVLVPFSINVAKEETSEDKSTKRKIYYEKDYDIEKRYADSQNNGAGKVMFMIGLVVVGILIITGIVFLIKAQEKYSQAAQFLDESWVNDVVKKSTLSTVNCGYYYQKLVELGYINRTINQTIEINDVGTGNKIADFTNSLIG